MAMKAHRDWGAAEKGIRVRRMMRSGTVSRDIMPHFLQEPNIVVCNTAHAAFDKAMAPCPKANPLP